MPSFTFKVLAKDRKVVTGTVVARHFRDAWARLDKTYGGNVLQLEEQHSDPYELAFFPFRRIRQEDVSIYTRQLSVLLRSGVSLPRSLEIVARGDNKPLNTVMMTVRRGVESGNYLSKCMEQFPHVFSSVYITLIKAAEVSGNLESHLQKLNDILDRSVRIRRRIIVAVTYPAVLGVIATALMLAFVFFVIPLLEPLFHSLGVQLPAITRLLLAIVDFLHSFKLMLLTLLVGALVFSFAWNYSRTDEGRAFFEHLLTYVPGLGRVFTDASLARVLYVLSMLLESGITLGPALKVVEKASDSFLMEQGLRHSQLRLMSGESMRDSLAASEMLPKIVLHFIDVGERAGRLPQMLLRAADMYEEQLNTTLDNLATLLEPLMLVVMGCVIGFISLAAFLPIISLLSAF